MDLPRIDVAFGAFVGALAGLLLLIINAYNAGVLTPGIILEPGFTVLVLVIIQFGVQWIVRRRQYLGKIATGAVAAAIWLIIQTAYTTLHGDPIIDTAAVVGAITLVVTTIVTVLTPAAQPVVPTDPDFDRVGN